MHEVTNGSSEAELYFEPSTVPDEATFLQSIAGTFDLHFHEPAIVTNYNYGTVNNKVRIGTVSLKLKRARGQLLLLCQTSRTQMTSRRFASLVPANLSEIQEPQRLAVSSMEAA